MRKLLTLLLTIILAITSTGCDINILPINVTKPTVESTTSNTESETTTESKVEETTTSNDNDDEKSTECIVVPTTKPETPTSDTTSESTLALKQSNVPTIDITVKKYYAQYGYGTVFKNYGVYEFDDDITMGAVDTKGVWSKSPNVLDYEAYYGLTAYVKDQNIYVKAYNHSIDHPILSSEIISDMNDTKTIEITYDDYTMIDCKNYNNGLYAIHTSFDKREVYLYFYINNTNVYTVRCLTDTSNTAYTNEKLIFNQLVLNEKMKTESIKPNECLSIDDIVYPCIESPGHRCDTERWAQLSHDLLNGHTEWSDEFKIFVYTTWFINNTKYDCYRTNVLGCSRAMKYGVWDGTYSLWDLKVGVCCDFTNAMVIMLREQGIPATSLESDKHMWIAIYLDDLWRELDITTIMPYTSYNKDAKDCEVSFIDFTDYLANNRYYDFITIGADIWTYNRAKYGHQ